MAEGKNINIRIAATGGDQAAAEFKKAGDGAQALGAAAGPVDDLVQKLEELQKRAESLAEPMDEAAESAEGLDKKVGDIARVQKAQAVAQLAGSVGQLGAKFLETAGRVKAFDADLAETLTTAGKGLQTLGNGLNNVALGFAVGGPVGAAAAGVVVAVQAIGDAWIESKAAAAEAAADAQKVLDGYAEAARNAADARQVERIGEWFDALDEEEQYYERINAQLARQIVAQSKLLALKSGADSAERAARIADIEADPDKKEADKVREIAAIREEEAAAKVKAEKEKLQQESALAFVTAADTSLQSGRQAKDASVAEKEAQRLEQIAKAREFLSKDAAEAATKLPGLRDARTNVGQNINLGTSPGSRPDLVVLQAAIDRRKQLDEQIQAAEAKAAQREELAADAERARTQAAEARSKAKEQQDQARAAALAAQNSLLDFESTDTTTQAGTVEIERRANSERRQRELRTETQIRAAQQRAEENKKRDDENAARNALTSRIAAGQGTLDADAGREGGDLRKRGNRGGDKTMESIGRSLQNGTNADELSKLADDIQAAMTANKTANGALLMQIINGLQTQAKELEILRQQLKNKK